MSFATCDDTVFMDDEPVLQGITPAVQQQETNRSIGTMTIKGAGEAGVWIDGVKQEPRAVGIRQQSSKQEGTVIKIYFEKFENCTIGNLRFEGCQIPQGITFKQCEIKEVKTSDARVAIHGSIEGNCSSVSGPISCGGNIRGNCLSSYGPVVCSGDIQGNVTSVIGKIEYGKKNSENAIPPTSFCPYH